MFRKIWIGIVCILGLLVLIMDNETAMFGAQEGVDLCIRSVIPSLFPFLYLSGIITGALSSAAEDSNPRTFRRILLVTGYLGGYPVGAQSTVQAYRKKLIAPQEVKRLLICCNNPGPAFIFGIAASAFDEKWIIWVLWAIHITSSLVTYWLIVPDIHDPRGSYSQSNFIRTSPFLECIRNMAQICGWIILFRVLICILEYRCLNPLPRTWQIAVCGLLELTNGCIALDKIHCLGLRFCMCALFLSFGGCCTLIQTHCVTNGLHTKSYVLGKLLEGCCSFLLAYILQLCLLQDPQRFYAPMLLWGGIIILIAVFVLIIRKFQNTSSNSSVISV